MVGDRVHPRNMGPPAESAIHLSKVSMSFPSDTVCLEVTLMRYWRDVLTMMEWNLDLIDLAENANQFDKAGHAQHAKDLLQQSRDEIVEVLSAPPEQ